MQLKKGQAKTIHRMEICRTSTNDLIDDGHPCHLKAAMPAAGLYEKCHLCPLLKEYKDEGIGMESLRTFVDFNKAQSMKTFAILHRAKKPILPPALYRNCLQFRCSNEMRDKLVQIYHKVSDFLMNDYTLVLDYIIIGLLFSNAAWPEMIYKASMVSSGFKPLLTYKVCPAS
uniref:Uncharacterized protein n=1 Tax=Romanomermis culicivorax TaxID=13658 RepID=A0A915JSG7_ROMCU